MDLTTTIMDLKHDLSKVIDKLVNVEQGQENLNHKIKENGQEVKDKIDSISLYTISFKFIASVLFSFKFTTLLT